MAIRYTSEHLLFLRDSPLCTKPEKLPPAEDWMGPPPDQTRAQNKPVNDRPRSLDNPLLDQTNRRAGINHHASRNSTNPEDIVFAPPRMAFASSGRGSKTLDSDKSTKDTDAAGRFGLRPRNGEADGDRLRATNAIRRRGENDLDSDGWSTVKPRKSFGAEGAERFHGRMGGNFRDEKKPLRENDRDATRDRPTRAFDGFARDKEVENDNRTRNSAGRSKVDSWHKAEPTATESPAAERKERDRTKSWRDRDTTETTDDRANGRAPDRRWARDRDQRVEREPEWFDEPAEALREAHTQQDFQKWMEQMKKGKGGGDAPERPAATSAAPEPAAEAERPHLPHQPSSAIESGPDKFFLAFGMPGPLEPNSPPSEVNDTAARPKAAGKSSRFTSFFHQPQDEPRNRVEQSTSVPPPLATQFPPGLGPLSAPIPAPEEEKQAFQQLLLKLQKQSMSATPPAPSPFAPPPQGIPIDIAKKSNLASPEPFQQYGGDRTNGNMGRPPPQHVQEILAPRPQQQSARPDQLLQDLVGHHQRISSQGSGIPDQARNNNNTEFLMNLMRMGPGAPLSMPQSQPQPQKQVPMQEPDFSPRDNRGGQRQMRPQPPPGFPLDESFHNAERDSRLGQPTQILQRPPPPPGLDQMPPNWMASGGQIPPPQQRGPMMPPPGLPAGMSRNVPMPHMFPPNFPPAGMPPPPPEALAGMPPRNMPPPPPGFFNGPPHGFMPPGLGGFNGPPGPPEAFGGSPFEARGMPPGAAGRGAAYGRP
ncbi:hypothetical protein TARUN_3755 [Trichoderma arundinaceum]|uniref:Uncharacterized protein n=1 Tax=Trichoderma arundinaceum TaxID=490622 RepID=A0A395NR72_TRIAR|nr:hypothetical protein TARUN_3755 [Trichoderma arundinaceum]